MLCDDLVIKFVADAGTATPAAIAVAAIALALIKSRLVKLIVVYLDAEANRHRYDGI